MADRPHAEVRVALGDEAAPVARALAGRAGLDLGDVGAQLERRLEAPRRRVLAEGVEAVDRDAAAHEIEMGPRLAQHGRAVGGVGDQPAVAALLSARPACEALQLAR